MADAVLIGDNISVSVSTDVTNKEITISGIGGSTAQVGVVPLATQAEITQGTNTSKAVTAKDVKAMLDALIV